MRSITLAVFLGLTGCTTVNVGHFYPTLPPQHLQISCAAYSSLDELNTGLAKEYAQGRRIATIGSETTSFLYVFSSTKPVICVEGLPIYESAAPAQAAPPASGFVPVPGLQ